MIRMRLTPIDRRDFLKGAAAGLVLLPNTDFSSIQVGPSAPQSRVALIRTTSRTDGVARAMALLEPTGIPQHIGQIDHRSQCLEVIVSRDTAPHFQRAPEQRFCFIKSSLRVEIPPQVVGQQNRPRMVFAENQVESVERFVIERGCFCDKPWQSGVRSSATTPQTLWRV